MSSFFWNVRGFNKISKHSVVKKWIQQEKLQFGCLLETRVRHQKAENIVKTVFQDWSFISNYDSHRLGRIWVVWSPNVRLTPCFTSSQMVTCSVKVEGMENEQKNSFKGAASNIANKLIAPKYRRPWKLPQV